MLAAANFGEPLFWAVFIGWILSVTLHEFAHGLVAYLGGDYTIRERGGLTLNPLQYVDPMFSLILPAIIFLIGGVPLPGGVTYIRDDLLRNRAWRSAVAAAGPAMNFLLFLLCCLFLHPSFGWVKPAVSVTTWSNAQLFVGAMAFLQLLSVILNLIPVPPLDGFQIISPFLKEDLRLKLTLPPIGNMIYFGYFLLLASGAPGFWGPIYRSIFSTFAALGVSPRQAYEAFNAAIWGST